MATLVDTNVIVYCFDARDAEKQRIARELLRRGMIEGELVLPHQAIIEFVAAVTRPRKDLGGAPLLVREHAYRQARELMSQYPILYPGPEVLDTALLGAATYGLPWFDAHLWAYAEVNGLSELLSEDFEHGRYYGSVRVVDPFLAAAGEVHELPPMYDSDSLPRGGAASE